MGHRSERLGRNDTCPCGSGRKVKKCHGIDQGRRVAERNREEMERNAIEAAIQHMNKHVRAEEERQRQYGKVRDIISAEWKGHRFVAVGGRLHYSTNWRNFTDFLIFYVKHVMGKDWWVAEASKSANDRHPIAKWHDHLVDVQRDQSPDPETGLVSAVRDGILSALLALAYDLYVLRSYAKLQDEVIARLKHPHQFQGARYELFVAATFIRAGCDIAYEDESDGKKKHTEFVARHQESGFEMAVEAKARHRNVRGEFDMATIRPGVRDLLLNAAGKGATHPLVVFVELNLPPEDPTKEPSWVPHVAQVVQEITPTTGKSQFDLLIFTNRPHLYGEAGEPDPPSHGLQKHPSTSSIPDALANVLGDAAAQYGNVPTEFPKDFSQVS